MSMVSFTFKNGRTQVMNSRQAELFRRNRLGTYHDRSMENKPQVLKAPAPVKEPVEPGPDQDEPEPGITNRTPEEVDAYIKQANSELLDEMGINDLRKLAKDKGIRVRANFSAERIRKAVRSAK